MKAAASALLEAAVQKVWMLVAAAARFPLPCLCPANMPARSSKSFRQKFVQVMPGSTFVEMRSRPVHTDGVHYTDISSSSCRALFFFVLFFRAVAARVVLVVYCKFQTIVQLIFQLISVGLFEVIHRLYLFFECICSTSHPFLLQNSSACLLSTTLIILKF
jgi:hypothetical protein